MQIAWSAAPCAHGEFARQMRLCAGSERSDLLMPDMNSLDFTVPTNSIRQTVEAVADDAVDAFHARGDEGLDELIGHNIAMLLSLHAIERGLLPQLVLNDVDRLATALRRDEVVKGVDLGVEHVERG